MQKVQQHWLERKPMRQNKTKKKKYQSFVYLMWTSEEEKYKRENCAQVNFINLSLTFQIACTTINMKRQYYDKVRKSIIIENSFYSSSSRSLIFDNFSHIWWLKDRFDVLAKTWFKLLYVNISVSRFHESRYSIVWHTVLFDHINTLNIFIIKTCEFIMT